MKKMITLTLLLFIVGMKAFAYDICVKNADDVDICYNYINHGRELEVTSGKGNYQGTIIIPEEVICTDGTFKVTKIGEKAFYNCTTLTSVSIPNSVKTIGISAFSGCIAMTSISLGNSITAIDFGAFYCCASLNEISFPNSITFIGGESFYNCKSIKSIKIPYGVSTVGLRTFACCENLISVDIPNSVTIIGDQAFYDCINLTSANIPNKVTEIGPYAFMETQLSSVTLPNTLELIGWGAFGCDLSVVISEIEYPFNIDAHQSFRLSTLENGTLYVPLGTIDRYKERDGWKEFVNIKEGSPSHIKNIETYDVSDNKRYTIDGRTIKNPQKGINIIQMDNGTTKKVIVK